MTTHRPYQQEVAYYQLQDSINAFNVTRQVHKQQKNKRYYNKVQTSKQAIKYNAKKQEKKVLKKAFKIVVATIIVFVCLCSSLFVKVQINENAKQIDRLEQNNQLLLNQNQNLEYSLLSDIDGKSYREYISEDLGMIKNNRNKCYIKTDKFRQEKKNSQSE